MKTDAQKLEELQEEYNKIYTLYSNAMKLIGTQDEMIEGYKKEVSILEELLSAAKRENEALERIREEERVCIE